MKKISDFFKEIFRTLKNINETMISSNMIMSRITEDLRNISSSMEILRQNILGISETTKDSMHEVNTVMKAISEDMRNIYAFSKDLRNGVRIDPKPIQSIMEESKEDIPAGALYGLCIQSMGKGFSTNTMYGSADTVNALVDMLTGSPVGGMNSDSMMHWFLTNDKNRFEKVDTEAPGDIVISPTGLGKNIDDIGNVGIVGENGKIFANNHATGKLDDHLTVSEWIGHYKNIKGFPVEFFRLK